MGVICLYGREGGLNETDGWMLMTFLDTRCELRELSVIIPSPLMPTTVSC